MNERDDEPNNFDDDQAQLDLEADHTADNDDGEQYPELVVHDDFEDHEVALARIHEIVDKARQKVSPGNNVPAEYGIIEEIRCQNFMCHERLTVQLGPLINFIIGHNGSGKSAVLTALILCLGGKAAATSRGHSLKSFIKEGRDKSTLTVKIKNQGSSAYKPELYGDSVIVERWFNKKGASGFKLMDRNGNEVDTKRSELEDIIDFFGLAIDNPLNVLTQDKAREFLNDSNPKEKYKFFLQGTQLETLDRDYVQIQQELDEQESKITRLEKDVEDFKHHRDECVKKFQAAHSLKKLKIEEDALINQGCWATVVAKEQEAAKAETTITGLSKRIDELKADAELASDQFDQDNAAVDRVIAELGELRPELQAARDYEKDSKQAEQNARKKTMELKATERNMNQVMSKSEASIQNTQSQINERRSQADGGLHTQKLAELDNAKNAFESRKSAWDDHDGAHLAALKQNIVEAKERRKQLVDSQADKRKEESRLQARIRTLEQGQTKWSDSYANPSLMERLVRAIETDRRFRDRPVGPIGRYVELKDPHWSSILEKVSGAALNAFVVTNKADQNTLQNLMKQMN